MSKPMAVLIVEADLPTRHLLEAVVRRNQFTASASGDGEAALHELEATDFDVILLDLFLPRIDGWEILRRLDLATPHLLHRIIVVTAASESEYRDCEPIRSVWCVMHKPFELAALEEQLLECCAQRQRDAARLAGHA
jgi:DNA-binding response OmpR family regulator